MDYKCLHLLHVRVKLNQNPAITTSRTLPTRVKTGAPPEGPKKLQLTIQSIWPPLVKKHAITVEQYKNSFDILKKTWIPHLSDQDISGGVFHQYIALNCVIIHAISGTVTSGLGVQCFVGSNTGVLKQSIKCKMSGSRTRILKQRINLCLVFRTSGSNTIVLKHSVISYQLII